MNRPVNRRRDLVDELTTLLVGARAAATCLDGAALDTVMRSLHTWFTENSQALARDASIRGAAVVALREVRDLCSVMATAIRDGLFAATSRDATPRYGPQRTTPDDAAPVLTRRYG